MRLKQQFKKMLTKKVQVQMDSPQNLTDLLKRPKNDALKLVHKIHNEVTVPNSICEISISLISKSDKDTTHIHTHLHAYVHKKTLSTNLPDPHRCKHSQQNSNQV